MSSQRKALIRRIMIETWEFVKLLRLEPYMLLMAFQYGLKATPNNQMIQDKICMQSYNATAEYCHNLPTTEERGNEPDHFKSRVLGDTAQFSTYAVFAYVFPSLFWTLFVGAWVDRYVKARKLLLLVSILANILENFISMTLALSWKTNVYFNLLLHIPITISGGGIGARIVISHYIASTTPPKLLAIRFMIYETCWSLATPIGQSVGGYVLVQEPKFHTGEIRNYTMCFIISTIFEVLALIWVYFIIDEKIARKQELKIEMNRLGIKGKIDDKCMKIKLRSDMSPEDKGIHPLRLLLDIENVKAMMRTVFVMRPNKARKQLLFCILSFSIQMGQIYGLMAIEPQFIQQVYNWGPDMTSYMSSISMLSMSICNLVLIPVMSKILKVADVQMALFGFIIQFTTNMIKGSWLSPNAYYLSMAINAIGGMASIGVRSHVIKVVDKDEVGRVMSFVSALDTLAPVVSTTVFAYIFKYTILTYPGTVFHIVAGSLIIPILVMLWINRFTKRLIVEKVYNDSNYEEENQNIEPHKNIKYI